MTSRGPDNDDAGEQDPVEEFFAAHRAQVHEEPADDLTWQRIRDGRRRGGSRRRGAWAGGLLAAAAALAVVFGPGLLPDAVEPDLAGPQPSVTEPATGDPSPADAPPTEWPTGSTGPTSADGTTGPTGTDDPDEPQTVTTPVPEQLPEGGRLTDVSLADPESGTDAGGRYALVMEECPANGFCAMLLTSEDGGTDWEPQADLRELGLVHRIFFADQRRGWVWGDKAPVWATTDGGRTWTQILVDGDAVEEVSVQGDALLAVTVTYESQTCTSSDCPVVFGQVVLTDPADTDWRDNGFQDLGAIQEAELLAAGDTLYVVARQVSSGPVTRLLRLQDDQLESTADLMGCGAGPVAVTLSTQDPQHLWALCDHERGLALHESENGGRTWSPTNVTAPSFVLGERAPLLVSTAADHLLLIGEGNYAVTTDGGETWSSEDFLPGAEARPERLQVVRSGEVIAYPAATQASTDLAYWSSTDGGTSWAVVGLNG